MTDIRSKQNFLNIPPVENLFFQIKSSGFSFSVDLSWFYKSDSATNVIGFKVYKANMSKPLLTKSVAINQRTLEKTSINKSAIATANVLYNKSLFSQNSKVKVLNSNSDKYKKEEGVLSKYSFQSIAFVVANKSTTQNSYKFSDRNIKFGESYVYYVTAITKAFKETDPNLIFVPVEFIAHPQAPSYLKTSETSQGILLVFGTYEKNISDFVIFRKSKEDETFRLLDKLEANTSHQYYTDIDVFPKKTYTYRIFCRDIWGNVSLSSIEKKQSFTYIPLNTSLENQPEIKIESTSEGFSISVIKNKSQNIEFVKIERCDEWKFDTSFEVKSFDGFPCPASFYFGSGQKIEYVDKSISKNRSYSYKITSFNKNCFAVSYAFVKNVSHGESYSGSPKEKTTTIKPRISSFVVDVLNKNQFPVFVKCNWNIVGNWSHIVINNGISKARVDNLHKVAYLSNFESNRNYDISVELYDLELNKIEEIKAATISI